MKGCANTCCAFSGDLSVMVLHYFFTNGQTNSGTGVFFIWIKPLENGENFRREMIIETYTIIGKPDVQASVFFTYIVIVI